MRRASPQPAGATLASQDLSTRPAHTKKGEIKASHPLRFRHQVVLHPPLGPIPGELVLRYLLKVEDGYLGRRPTDAAARRPLKIFYGTRLRLHLWLLRRLQQRQSQEGPDQGSRSELSGPGMVMLGLGLCVCRPAFVQAGAAGTPACLCTPARNKGSPPASRSPATRWADRVLSHSHVYKHLCLLVREFSASHALSGGINSTEKDAPQGRILPPQRWHAAGACLLPRERRALWFFFPAEHGCRVGWSTAPKAPGKGNAADCSTPVKAAPWFFGGGCSPFPPTPPGTTHARGDAREKTTSVRRLHLPCPALSCPQALQLCRHPRGGMAPLLGLRRRPGGSPRPSVLTAHGSRGRLWICTSCRSVDS